MDQELELRALAGTVASDPDKFKFSKARIERWLKVNSQSGKQRRCWDTDTRGLYIRLYPSGRSSYSLRLPGGVDDYVIGGTDQIKHTRARTKATQDLAEFLQTGVSPNERRQQEAVEAERQKAQTFSALANLWFRQAAHRPPHVSKRTYGNCKRMLEVHILPRIGHIPYEELTRTIVKNTIREIRSVASQHPNAQRAAQPGVTQANECQAVIRKIWEWAIDSELTDKPNPASYRRPKDMRQQPKRRPRMPNEAARLIWSALREDINRRTSNHGKGTALAILIVAATGQRPHQVAEARREHFDLSTAGQELWNAPAEFTKTNRPYTIPLSPLAVSLIKEALALHDSEWLFPRVDVTGAINSHDLSQRFGRLRKALITANPQYDPDTGVFEGVSLYSWRRLPRTVIESELGFPEYVAEACIEHISHARQINRLYHAGATLEQKREAFVQWEGWLQDNVINSTTEEDGCEQLLFCFGTEEVA